MQLLGLPMYLSNHQLAQLQELIVAHYSVDEFRQLVSYCLDDDFNAHVVISTPYPAQIYDYLQWVNRGGKQAELVSCLAKSRPNVSAFCTLLNESQAENQRPGIGSDQKNTASQTVVGQTEHQETEHEEAGSQFTSSLLTNVLSGVIVAAVAVAIQRYFLPSASETLLSVVAGIVSLVLVFLLHKFQKRRADGKSLELLSLLVFPIIVAIAVLFMVEDRRTGMLILDVSDQMSDKLKAVTTYINSARLPDEIDYIGLISYGGGLSFKAGCDDVTVQVEPTERAKGDQEIRDKLNVIALAKPSGPETIQSAIVSAIEALKGRKGFHRLILISAGDIGSTCDPLSREFIDEKARSLGVDYELSVIVVGEPSPDDVSRLRGFARTDLIVVPLDEVPGAIESELARPKFSPYDFFFQPGY